MAREFVSRRQVAGRRGMRALLAALAGVAASGTVAAQEDTPDAPATPQAVVQAVDPAMLKAEPAPMAAGSLLLDVAEGDQRAIVVGERGHVLVSESRQDWRQVTDVPTRTTLTGVATAGSDAWAVGHAQVILHSDDGGLSWERQHADPYDPGDWEDIANGAPLLDVLFLDATQGIAIGAYGLMLVTTDGGATWTRQHMPGSSAVAADAAADVEAPEGASPEDAEGGDEDWTFSDEDLLLEELSDPHLNAIASTGSGALFIAAERGSAFRSRDQGRTWERISIPYDGSMFGVLGFDGDRVLVFGLRGNVFESQDLGSNWTALDTGTEQTLQGGAALPDGGAVLVGSGGVVLLRRAAGEPFEQHVYEDGGVLAEVLPVGGASQLVLVGERGIARFSAN